MPQRTRKERVGHGRFNIVRVSAARAHKTITERAAPLVQGWPEPEARPARYVGRGGRATRAVTGQRWPSTARVARTVGGPAGRGHADCRSRVTDALATAGARRPAGRERARGRRVARQRAPRRGSPPSVGRETRPGHGGASLRVFLFGRGIEVGQSGVVTWRNDLFKWSMRVNERERSQGWGAGAGREEQ